MAGWAEKWTKIGLRTGEADWDRFEAAAKECYRFAGIPWPGVVVRVPSPLVGALAAPIASALLRSDAVDGAVRVAVSGVVDDAVDGIPPSALKGAISTEWTSLLGGQFWAGGWYWGGAWTSFFREVCGLALPGDLWDRGRAYEATIESACWWWPNRRFVMVCDRPKALHFEDVPGRPHRLHCLAGPAAAWDGWGVYAIHGVRVPEKVVMAPESITADEILKEPNAEIRRVMLDRLGRDRFVAQAKAKVVHEDTDKLGHPRRLLRVDVPEDEPVVMLEVTNSTQEPDGAWRNFLLPVPPSARVAYSSRCWADVWHRAAPQPAPAWDCQAAVAWRRGLLPDEYRPVQES